MEKLEYDRDYQDRLQTKKRENEVIHKGVLEYKSNMHERQSHFEAESKASKIKRNPFNDKVNKESLANATKVKERKVAGATTYAEDTGMDMFGDDDGY